MSAGSIIKRQGKRGVSYLIKYESGRNPVTHKRQTLYKTVHGTKAEAQQELRKLLRAVDRGTHVDPLTLTVNEWLDLWLEQRQKDLGAKTFERYGEVLSLYVRPRIGSIRMQKLNSTELENMIAEAKDSVGAGTIRYIFVLVKAAFAKAVKQKVIARNPADDVESPPKAPKASIEGQQIKKRALEAESVVKLLQGFEGKRLYPLVRVAVGTGMRRGELLALRWNDIDLDKRIIKVERSLEQSKEYGTREKDGAKTESGFREVPITETLTKYLRTYWKSQAETALQLGIGLGKDALLFPNSPITPAMLRNPDLESGAFRRAAGRMGFKGLRFHDLRHTYATLLLAGGAHIKTVSQRLGHSDPKITMSIYAHSINPMEEQVTAIAESIGL